MAILNAMAQKTEGELLREINTSTYMRLEQGFQRAFDTINNSENIQGILDEYGTDAGELFKASRDTIMFLMRLNPSYVPPASDHDFIFNADGTVTLVVPEPDLQEEIIPDII